MRKFVIERMIEGVGSLSEEQLGGAAATSNQALAKLAPRVQWMQSYVSGDRTFCIYLSEDEAAIHEHARLSGFPATRIYEVVTIIDPATDRQNAAARSAA